MIELDGTLPSGSKAGLHEQWLSESSQLRASAKAIFAARDAASTSAADPLAQFEHAVNCSAPCGALEAWSGLIRSTLMWLELPDPWLASLASRGPRQKGRLLPGEPVELGHRAEVSSHAD